MPGSVPLPGKTVLLQAYLHTHLFIELLAQYFLPKRYIIDVCWIDEKKKNDEKI